MQNNNITENESEINKNDIIQETFEANHENNTQNELETELEKVKAKADEYYDLWLRAKADGENIRRRSIEELDKMRKFAVENLAESLLPIMDSLQAVLADNSGNIETMKQGIDLTVKQLQSVFDKQKIVAINSIGEALNPAYHQAISSVASDEPANTVINVLQKGYTISERLLRPALVVVSAGNN